MFVQISWKEKNSHSLNKGYLQTEQSINNVFIVSVIFIKISEKF